MDPSPSYVDPKQPSDQSKMLTRPQQDSEFWPLSDKKPYFYVVLQPIHFGTKSHLTIPRRVAEKLPASMLSAMVYCRGKEWNLLYMGDQGTKKFENQHWERFVRDNNLKVGDACVFELIEEGLNLRVVKFKVQILKDDFPSELMEKAEGHNMNNPIDID